MKKWFPLILTAIFGLWFVSKLSLPSEKEWALNDFGRLPVKLNGRLQPIDTLARNALLQIRKKQTLNIEPWKGTFASPRIYTASEWAVELMVKPEVGDTRPVFRIDHPELKGLFNLPAEPDETKQTDGKHFSWSQLQPKWELFKTETRRAMKVKDDLRNPYERSIMELWKSVNLYKQVRNTLGPVASGDLATGLQHFEERIESGRIAFQAQMDGKPFDEAALDWLNEQFSAPLIVPIGESESHGQPKLQSMLQEAANIQRGAAPHGILIPYSKIAAAYRAGDAPAFRASVEESLDLLGTDASLKKGLAKAHRELLFNHAEPFYFGMIACVTAFLLSLLFWFGPERFEWARRSAVWLMVLAILVHTGGLIFRMVQEGRPPVTNLYSSAIFIGWGAAVLGLLLERFYPFSIGVVTASALEFLTLQVAHVLARDGDTMEMLRAVLDTNFWLATHVVVVTLGYASTFVAGFLAIQYVVRGKFTKSITPEIGKAFGKMVYAILCFATLFSFVGTVLGGIWADQSWGRFWGFDVKENGALIIVLWNAMILHARWGGLVRERGLMCLAIGGNIVTAWSWFGVNMLGIGLHSYGFINAAFWWLLAFVGTQLLLIFLGLTPQKGWGSFRLADGPREPAPDERKREPQPA